MGGVATHKRIAIPPACVLRGEHDVVSSDALGRDGRAVRSEEHTSELQSLS